MNIVVIEQGNLTTTLTYILQDRGNGFGVRVRKIDPATHDIKDHPRLCKFFGVGETRKHAEQEARDYINMLRATEPK